MKKKKELSEKERQQIKSGSLLRHIKKEWMMYTFVLWPVIYFIVFKYVPMLGNVIAFRKYRGGPNMFGESWEGLRYFKQFISDQSFWQAFWNTLRLGIKYLAFRFPITLIFALLINEVAHLKLKKIVQTISYLPHFIAIVVVCGMIKEMVSLNGPINNLLSSIGINSIPFISEAKWFDTLYISSGIWQGLGWGTILYLAAMTGINTELYEAAAIDGASKFKQALHVTIPGIMPTIMTLLILDIGGIITSGNMQKVLLLYNPMTYSRADIIGTYVYRMGIAGGKFSYATAVGLFEGLIGLVLVTGANIISRKTTETSLW